MSAELAQRVRYQEGQVLRAADLEREQQYRLEKRWRHNIAHHRWGIVSGLRLEKEGDAIVVQPGMAVDGFGRELFVPEAVCLEPKELDQVGSQVIQVWLVYRRVPVTPPQRGRFDCGPGRHSRWSEEAWLELTPGSPSQPVHPLNPGAVAAADREFSPHQTSPDDPDRAWPVYLGRIERTSANNYEPDMAVDRPYVKLNGQLIVAPSGRAQMQVGNEAANDRRRFAVGVPEPEARDSAESPVEQADAEDGLTDRLTIDHQGNLSVVHDTTLHAGDMIIANPSQGTTTQFRRPGSCVYEYGSGGRLLPSVEFEPLPAPPAEAAPWQIYRTDLKMGEDEEAPTFHQLRFEIQHPGDRGDPARHQFVAGSTHAGASEAGVFKSDKAGTAWAPSSRGLESTQVQFLIIDPSNANILYAATNGQGVFKTTDGGTNWASSNTGLTNLLVSVLVIDLDTTTNLYAGTEDGAFKSTDGGATWTASNNGLANTSVRFLAMAPTNSSILYAGTKRGGMFKSIDGAVTWSGGENVLEGTVKTLAIDPNAPNRVYAGTSIGKVYRSIDSGATWAAVDAGLENTKVQTLAVHPNASNVLYAGTGGQGVFRSGDGGDTWVTINTGLTNRQVHVLSIDPDTPGTLYVGTEGGVFKSTNSGLGWSASNTGLDRTQVRALAIDPDNPDTLYAGTFDLRPCLTVTAGCNVTVHGDLTVEGQVARGSIGPDPADPLFASALLNSWVESLATAGASLDALYNTLAIVIAAPEDVQGPNGPLSFTVTVQKLRPDDVEAVRIVGTVTVLDNNIQVRQEIIDHEIGKLGTGSDTFSSEPFDPQRSSGEIVIAVVAIGVGPTGSPVIASAQAVVTIV